MTQQFSRSKVGGGGFKNPLTEDTTSESAYASAVRRSPPPPKQTNHNGRPYHNDRRPPDAHGYGRVGGPGTDNRARNAQNGRGNNNN